MKIIFWWFQVNLWINLKVIARRDKRTLLFPEAASHSWIAAFGIPVDIDDPVIVGYRIAGSFPGPGNVDDFYPLYSWEGIERNRRSAPDTADYDKGTERKQGDSHDSNGILDEEEESISHSHTSRWDTYSILEGIMSRHGLGGKACVLRTICESASAPISHKSGLFGQLLHILFTPSSSKDKITTSEHQEYLNAEQLGIKDHGSCAARFTACSKSLLDIISTFNNPFDIINGHS